jgi:hypothetical protein
MLKRTKQSNPLVSLFGCESPDVKLEAWKIHHRTVRLRYLAGIAAAAFMGLRPWHWLG